MEDSENYHDAMATMDPQPSIKKDKAVVTVPDQIQTSLPKPTIKEYGDDVATSTVAPGAPVTAKRKLRMDLDNWMPKPYLPRAMVAADAEHSQGTLHPRHTNLTCLQQHVAFFDIDDNGIIYPWETYRGFRDLGFSISFSLLVAVVINISLAYRTWPVLLVPDFFLFPIHIRNIHRTKHGSDSEVYDTEGRFCPEKFECIFSKYAHTAPDKLTFFELWNMTEANRNLFDVAGWIGAKGEWIFLYLLASDDEGYLSKEAIRGVYDGSVFYAYSKTRRHGHTRHHIPPPATGSKKDI